MGKMVRSVNVLAELSISITIIMVYIQWLMHAFLKIYTQDKILMIFQQTNNLRRIV